MTLSAESVYIQTKELNRCVIFSFLYLLKVCQCFSQTWSHRAVGYVTVHSFDVSEQNIAFVITSARDRDD